MQDEKLLEVFLQHCAIANILYYTLKHLLKGEILCHVFFFFLPFTHMHTQRSQEQRKKQKKN